MSAPQTFRLTTGGRILRGSKRIGAFLAALVFVCGAALAIGNAYSTANYAVSAYAQARCLSQKTTASLVADQYGSGPAQYRFADNGCPGSAYSATEAEVRATLSGGAPAFGAAMVSDSGLGLAASLAAAAAVFALCWGMGWVVAGFTAD